MNKTIRVIGVTALVTLLFLVRIFEVELFYDPLILYFQNDYLYKPAPKIDFWYLILHLFFRYTINSLSTIGIIYLMFLNKGYVKFSVFVFLVVFIIMIFAFGFLLKTKFEFGYLLPFYIRKFIIHPLLLLILLPSFYYLRKRQK